MNDKYLLKGELQFEGRWDKNDKFVAQTLYPLLRNMYVSLTNPLLEELNELWDEISETDPRSYDEFIVEALNVHVAPLTWRLHQKTKEPRVVGCFDKESCDFILVNKNGGKCYMTIVDE